MLAIKNREKWIKKTTKTIIKNYTWHYYDDAIKIEGFNFNNILLDKK